MDTKKFELHVDTSGTQTVYGIWNNDMKSLQYVPEWQGTFTTNKQVAEGAVRFKNTPLLNTVMVGGCYAVPAIGECYRVHSSKGVFLGTVKAETGLVTTYVTAVHITAEDLASLAELVPQCSGILTARILEEADGQD